MFFARRSTMEAERQGRGVALRLRVLVASIKASEGLVKKSARARAFALPFQQIRAKLTPTKKQPKQPATKPSPLDNVGICGRSPLAARAKLNAPPVTPNVGGFVGRSPQGVRPTRVSSAESSEEWVKVA
jgi:hypothetical protein